MDRHRRSRFCKRESSRLRAGSDSQMVITFALLVCARRLKRAHLLAAGFGRCGSTENACTRSRYLIILGQPASCGAAQPMIFLPSLANRTSPSWKPRHSLAISCPDVFHADKGSPSFSTNTRRKPVQSLCIPKNRHSAQLKAAKKSTVTRRKEKHERAIFLGSARVPRAGFGVAPKQSFL